MNDRKDLLQKMLDSYGDIPSEEIVTPNVGDGSGVLISDQDIAKAIVDIVKGHVYVIKPNLVERTKELTIRYDSIHTSDRGIEVPVQTSIKVNISIGDKIDVELLQDIMFDKSKIVDGDYGWLDVMEIGKLGKVLIFKTFTSGER